MNQQQYDEDASNSFASSVDTDLHAALNEEHGDGETEELAKKESQRVDRSKWVVFFIIALAAAVFGTCTYIVTRNGEQNDFESQVCAVLGREVKLMNLR